MRARSVAAIVSMLMLTACVGDDGRSTDTPASVSEGIDTTSPAPESAHDDTGTVRITLTVVEADQAPGAAAALDDALEGFDASPATVDGTRVVAEIVDVPSAEVDSIDPELRSPAPLQLRPVVALVDAEMPGNEILTTLDGETLAVGPSQGDRSAFGRAEVTTDQIGQWSVSVEIGDAVLWNALAQQCFNGQPTCPSSADGGAGRLAIVVDEEIISAPSVYQPTFDDVIVITGRFTEAEANALAATINNADGPFEVANREIVFLPEDD